MSYSIIFSKLFSSIGFKIVNKRIYPIEFFKAESRRLMRSIKLEYDSLIAAYPTAEDQRKGIENQILFVEMVHWLGLEKSQPLKILDIGGRGGLFAYFCKCYGHDSYVSDIPGVLNISPNKELLDLLDVKAIDLYIKPFSPIDVGGMQFDLVTGFRTRFHSRLPFETGKKYEEHWGVDEWNFFLKDLHENILTDRGRIFFMLNRLQEREKIDYVPQVLAEYFRSKKGILQQNFLHFPVISKPF